MYLTVFRWRTSRNRSTYIIRSFYNFCHRREYIDRNSSLKLEITPAPEKERVFLSEEEMQALILAVQPHLVKTILTTLFYTGMRISECVNLKLKDVYLKDGIITVRNTKNKRDRQIPIHQKLLPVLNEYCIKWRKPSSLPYLFISRNMGRVSPDYVNRILRSTAQRLGWKKHVTCHIIRHSFASSLVSRNVSIVNIQKLLGHTDLSTTSVYTHTNLSDLIKAVNTI
jgi:integrase/recombinase XerD